MATLPDINNNKNKINLTKDVQDPDAENYKAVFKDMKENNSNKNMGRKFDEGSTVALDIHLVLD